MFGTCVHNLHKASEYMLSVCVLFPQDVRPTQPEPCSICMENMVVGLWKPLICSCKVF